MPCHVVRGWWNKWTIIVSLSAPSTESFNTWCWYENSKKKKKIRIIWRQQVKHNYAQNELSLDEITNLILNFLSLFFVAYQPRDMPTCTLVRNCVGCQRQRKEIQLKSKVNESCFCYQKKKKIVTDCECPWKYFSSFSILRTRKYFNRSIE